MTLVVKIEKNGGPDVLKLQEITIEKPRPEEVLIENKAIGLNYIDTYHRSGLYPLKLPSGIGLEAAGIIKEIGSKVDNFSIGDHVAYASIPIGAYAKERIFPANKIVKVPNDISLKTAATIMTKGLTAFYLLFKTYKVNSNEIILFHAAAGGVGQIFCQWAKSLGCKIIGTVGSKEKVKIAKKNGCDFVINYSEEDFADRVMNITNGKGVPVVYDGVGKNTFEGSLKCLKTRGTMVSFGNSSGPLENINVSKQLQPKGLYFVRPSMGQYLSTREELTEASEKLFEALKFGKIKIEIYKSYDLSDVVQAHTDLENRKIIGPAVIIP